MESVDIMRRDSGHQALKAEYSAPLDGHLAKEVENLEQMFQVDSQKLKDISKRFQEELEEGLQQENGSIPMNITWVPGFPHGNEKGSFLTVDLGGTNLRVCWVTLFGGRKKPTVVQDCFKLPTGIKHGTACQLWDSIAERIETFVLQKGLGGTGQDPLPLGFTFSYPATQHRIDHGVLQTWTKGWDVKGVEGEDVAAQLRAAMQRKNLPIKLTALINDTTGALISSSYTDPSTIIGAIFGTGCNAAYMDHSTHVPKLGLTPNPTTTTGPLAINCEYGAFDNSHRVLPRTPYDATIDATSPRPGEQTFEKLSAGLYLGEIFRLALLDLHSKALIFEDQDVGELRKDYVLDTSFLSQVENDDTPSSSRTVELFKSHLSVTLTGSEPEVCRRIAHAIAIRGARLCACGIAAICRMRGLEEGHVAADGSVANKHPLFRKRWAQALGEILDWDDAREVDPIVLVPAEDGSGVGAAIIAAMVLERMVSC